MGLFDQLKKDNEENAKAVENATKKELAFLKDNNSERSHFIKKHRIFQSTAVHKVFAEAVKELKNNTRILEPNDLASEKMLPISGCYIDYKNSIFLVKIEAHPDTETANLIITINQKEIGHREYPIDGFDEKIMADDITKILRSFEK